MRARLNPMRETGMPMCFFMGLLLPILVLSCNLSSHMRIPVDNEISIIADRLRARLIESASRHFDPSAARESLRLQKDDGSWPDVDYDDDSRTHWKPSRHLSHLSALVHVYRVPGSALEGDVEVRDAFLAGLRFWVKRDPQSDNWWFNVIGSPRSLSDMLLLMVDQMPPDLVGGTAELIHRSGFTRTGTNLVHEAGNLLTLACATGHIDLLREAIDYISREVRVTIEEGIQHDDSFHQHGPQNMVISYGRGFAFDQAGYAALFAGTSFAFPKEKIRILSRFILDGQQWYIWGRQVDYHAMGRGAFRGNTGSHIWNAGGFEGMCRLMESADPDRAAEYAAFAARVTGERPSGSSGPQGNKHFWRSDTMVHRSTNWYASARFHSTRAYATETRTNRENLKGYHLSDGVYYLLQRGDEYHEIQPVWDYRKLPGLTFLDTAAPLPYGQEAPRAGNTSFVGGASDSLSGVSVMDYDKGGVRARKAYFFTNDGFVCLGAGITSSEIENVFSTLNQCLLKSDVAILSGGAITVLEKERLEAQNVRAIHHDGIAYVLLDDASVIIRAKQQTGSWQEVEAKASADQISQDIFTCWIDHGARPTDATYAYRIIPGARRDDLSALANSETVRVLANTAALQAVHSAKEGIIQAIFHAPGELSLPGGAMFHVDTACVVIFRAAGDATLLTVADPTQERVQLVVTLDGRYRGRGASYVSDDNTTHIVVDLPKGPYAGQSALVPLARE